MFHEIARKTILLPKYEDIDIVWHNNVLTIRCDSGLHLFDFSYNLKCMDKTIDIFESKIVTTKCSPASELFPKNCITPNTRNIELSQMVVDPALWPHNKHLMDASIIVTFEWSPVDFIHSNATAVATVNSAGNVDLYIQSRETWIKLEDLSLKLKDEMKNHFPNLMKAFQHRGKIDFELLKKTAYAVETSSICWSPVVNKDKSCYLVTGQKNGAIIFWSLKYDINKSVNVKMLHHIPEDGKGEIVKMKWINKSINQFILITANISGQIIAYECELENETLKITGTHTLWAHKDKMTSQYIHYEYSNEHIVIICNKHRHLVVLVIDKSCRVLYQNATNVNDHRITSVVKSRHSFYASTVNRELFKIKYVLKNETLDVHLVPVEIKPILSSYELFGLAFSTNDILLALPLLDRTILYRKTPIKLDIVFYTAEGHDLIDTIISHPSRTLTNLWDVIETLRCKILKSKVLPDLDYNKLYKQAQTDIFYCKIYLMLQIFYNTLEISVQNNSRGILPETSIDEIKSHILIQHIVELLKKICDTRLNIVINNADKLKVEQQCFYMARVYLKEYCKKSKRKLSELCPPNIIAILENVKDPQCICQWCDNALNGFACKDNHLNSFCSLTFTPIESNEYLVCRSCGTTARSDLNLDKPKCLFCDLYLCHCYLPS